MLLLRPFIVVVLVACAVGAFKLAGGKNTCEHGTVGVHDSRCKGGGSRGGEAALAGQPVGVRRLVARARRSHPAWRFGVAESRTDPFGGHRRWEVFLSDERGPSHGVWIVGSPTGRARCLRVVDA